MESAILLPYHSLNFALHNLRGLQRVLKLLPGIEGKPGSVSVA